MMAARPLKFLPLTQDKFLEVKLKIQDPHTNILKQKIQWSKFEI